MPAFIRARFDAIVFDLLTALIDSWSLWNSVAGSDPKGFAWRERYLEITYGCGTYRPYETLVREAAVQAGLPAELGAELERRWKELSPWPEAGSVLSGHAQRLPLAVATNCSDRPHCVIRIVPGKLRIASSELRPALRREQEHETGEHGNAGRADRRVTESLLGGRTDGTGSNPRRVCGGDGVSPEARHARVARGSDELAPSAAAGTAPLRRGGSASNHSSLGDIRSGVR